MLHGELVTLRELRREDLPVLHAAADLDPDVHAMTHQDPWRPVTLARRQADFDARLAQAPDEHVAQFAVQRHDDPAGRCIGWAVVWGIDLHNRTAHLGVTLTAQARGKGLGRDAVRVLCRYAFEVRDLHRVTIETLATNEAMCAAARACGFTEEGRLVESAFVGGRRVDEVLYGLLGRQWRGSPAGGDGA